MAASELPFNRKFKRQKSEKSKKKLSFGPTKEKKESSSSSKKDSRDKTKAPSRRLCTLNLFYQSLKIK